MTAYLTFPDAEAVVIQALLAAAITNAGTSVPSDGGYPFITVRRIGGVPAVRQALDAADIQVDVWADVDMKSEAHDLAQDARVAIHESDNQIIEYDTNTYAWVAGVDDMLGLSWLPDPVSKRDRYTFGVRVYLKPVTA